MTGVSGHPVWPGEDLLDAQSVVVGDLADTPEGLDGLPFLVRLPARGPWADATAQAAALLVDMPVELGVHGWKLADRPGHDESRARALVREGLDVLAVAAHGYAGPLVVPVVGPLTLAASLYLARGDRVLADAGAVSELAESLGAGLVEHLAAVRRAVPGAALSVVLHEPLLAQVVAGVLPSFSGYSALRPVRAPVAAERLRAVTGALRGAGAAGVERVVVHGGSAWSSIATVADSGADAVALAVGGFDERAWERVAELVERGTALWAELPPQASSQCAGPDVAGQAAVLLEPWRRIGLPAERLRDVVVLAPPVAAGATPDDARGALAGTVRAALIVAERAEG
ncbi:hypothetical protein [Cellulomonas cellasea]|uniref:Sugar phosphate isomerase/epimerase n=1 Tax=Cellulomonas cellasea TaxID=43670 RepID=A0A7W4Y8Z2_9CELL|nr:hypothetical protein [Cellulomonas cellasea]MBB2921130.1 sugar phosphate isomerase/epimerase [Cellulomonas cellasea]